MATGVPHRFSIRSLLILTAIFAVDLAWLRNRSDQASVVAVVFGVHLLMCTVVYGCYWVCSIFANRSDLYRIFLGGLSTTLAGACFASIYLPVLKQFCPEEASHSFAILIGLGVLGGTLAGALAIALAGVADVLAWFAPSRFQGRTQATLTGVLTAASLFFSFRAFDVPGIDAAIFWAPTPGFVIAICYPFGRLWDRAPLPPRSLSRYSD